MFEIDVKPRLVTLEEHRRFKVGKDKWEWRWVAVREYSSNERPFTLKELANLMNSYICNNFNHHISSTMYGVRIDGSTINGVRFVTSRHNQLVSDKSLDFITLLDTTDLGIACFRKDKDSVNEKLLFAQNNPAFLSFTELQNKFLEHQGIKNVRFYPVNEYDNFADCSLVTFNDGTEMTFSRWRSCYNTRIPTYETGY